MSANDDEQPAETAAPHRFSTAEARQKAEFILSRAYGLFRDPAAEWEQIRDEETNAASILAGYVAPLAALLPICNLVGSYVFGIASVRPPIGDAVVGNLTGFIATVAVVFALGLLINAVAENFDGDRNDLAAQKAAAYSMTPFLLSGVVWLWPPLWWISIVAFGASVYLLYRGLPILMKAPEDRAISYALSVASAGLVVFVIFMGLTSCVTGV